MKKFKLPFILIVTVTISLSAFSQSSSNKSWEMNLSNWGYDNNHKVKLLFKEATVRYYYKPSGLRYNIVIIAVHDIGDNVPFFGEPGTESNREKYLYTLKDRIMEIVNDSSDDRLNFNKTIYGINTRHYVKGFSIPEPDVTDSGGFEDPISSYSIQLDPQDFYDATYEIEAINRINSNPLTNYNTVNEARVGRMKEYSTYLDKKEEKKQKILSELAPRNPSNIILELDTSPKGRRKVLDELLMGKKTSDYVLGTFNALRIELERERARKEMTIGNDPLFMKDYFESIFYGHFDRIKSDKTKLVFIFNNDKARAFRQMHNGFLYYASTVYSKYYKNNILDAFTIYQTKRNKYSGEERRTGIETDYVIWIPNKLNPKFQEYWDNDWEHQFGSDNESFSPEFEWLALSFLSQHNPDSLAFKQLLENLYRYSNDLDPVTSKSSLMDYN